MVMPQIKDSKTLAAAGADKEDGPRPTIVSAPQAAHFVAANRTTFLYDNFLRSHGRLRRSGATKANHKIISN